MWNGGQLPWGKPYFQDVRETMLKTDPGYQQARQWWTQQQKQAAADANEVRRLQAELQASEQQYFKLEEDFGRTVANIDRLERFCGVSRGEVGTEPEAGAVAPRAQRAKRADGPGPVPDAGRPPRDDREPERPAAAPNAGLGKGASEEDRSEGVRRNLAVEEIRTAHKF
jgi:hypothetical protein